MTNFPKLLKIYRNNAGLSQAEIAEKLGMTRQNYSRYENEELNTQPTLDLLCKLSDILHTDPNTLIGYIPKFNEMKYAYKQLDNFEEHDGIISYAYLPGISFDNESMLDFIEKNSALKNDPKLIIDIPKDRFINMITVAHYMAKDLAITEAEKRKDELFKLIINRLLFAYHLKH